jgi:hypothetical protein
MAQKCNRLTGKRSGQYQGEQGFMKEAVQPRRLIRLSDKNTKNRIECVFWEEWKAKSVWKRVVYTNPKNPMCMPETSFLCDDCAVKYMAAFKNRVTVTY